LAAPAAIVDERPGVPSPVLAMALLLVTEAMLFAGLVSAYLVLRTAAFEWPPSGQPRLPVAVTGVNTLVLLASGWALRGLAGEAARARPKLRTALVLGAAFLALQGWEWVRLLRFGLGASASTYAGLFYATVGTHAVHVAAALVALGWGLVALGRGSLGSAGLRALRMFWWFVVAVWPVLYVVVYLW
jgi:heme/copper-type cytochrome/quinol oxidase subunit 3